MIRRFPKPTHGTFVPSCSFKTAVVKQAADQQNSRPPTRTKPQQLCYPLLVTVCSIQQWILPGSYQEQKVTVTNKTYQGIRY